MHTLWICWHFLEELSCVSFLLNYLWIRPSVCCPLSNLGPEKKTQLRTTGLVWLHTDTIEFPPNSGKLSSNTKCQLQISICAPCTLTFKRLLWLNLPKPSSLCSLIGIKVTSVVVYFKLLRLCWLFLSGLKPHIQAHRERGKKAACF